ncbi:hypothetical protein OCU04_011923 [Sclerotinia nivalis]|uniref:Uncharacterized protein n=1 Tax=Sclerotinia nivalis TaxID=352851 RepID=A0A9X0DFK9_9HELO|nr:hypothetical protein OCU04_011923 [Sclerotinia nivalis]
MKPALFSVALQPATTSTPTLHSNSNSATLHLPPRKTSTSTASTSSTSYRKSLSTPDHNNVIMRVVSQKDSAQLTAKSGNPNMPSYDKPNNNRPLAPTLSASANRGIKPKPPLTPKVSARPTSRQSRTENLTPNNAKEDLSTPVSTFLNSNNITARSSTRKTRFDTSNNSPSGTPAPSETPRLYDPTQNASGLGISGLEKDTSKRASVTFSPSNSDLNYSQSSQSSADSKFFFASDVKPQSHSSQQTKSSPTKRASTLFHANGDKVPKKPSPRSGASTVGSTTGEERGHAKFFHANGTPEIGLSPSPHFAPPRPSSVLSTHSRVTSPRLANVTTSPSQRPTSPQKSNTPYASISSVRSPTPLASPVLPRPKAGLRGQSANNINLTHSRRTSADGNYGHQRTTSTGSSMERLVLTRKVSSGGHSMDIPNPITITEPSSPASITHTDGILEGEEKGEEEEDEEGESEDEDEDEDDEEDSESISSEGEAKEEVLKAGGSIERMNELAAIARNERKVLDLEITNSSLEAINRTLEREMRKQTAELRRYKRLSRSGRLSMATRASSRATSGALSVVDEKESNDLSDNSQENFDLEDEEDEEEEGMSSEEDFIDDGTLSPGAVAEHDLKHRKKDEKRLRLDLSKHQQQLIDSQKMNQSLKKCLGWTEELINEGKRALDYRVKTSDIGPLAPRVLAPAEFDDDDVEIDNEGMSAIGASLLREARRAAAEQHMDKGDLDVPTETDEQLKDLTQDIHFALFASSGEPSEMLVPKTRDESSESVPIAPPTSPWVSTFTSRLQTRS